MTILPEKILSIGIKNAPIREHKKIRLLNSFCLWWLISMVLFIHVDFFLLSFDKFIKNTLTHFFFAIMLFTVFLFQHKNLIVTARILFIGSITTATWFFCFIEPGKLIEQYFIIIPLISLTFIENKWINIFVGVLAFSSTIINYQTRDEYISLNYQFPVVLTLFIGAYWILNYAKNLNEKNEKLLAEQRDQVLSDKVILEKQEAELRELNDFKSHFFVNLSHEIRTPITLIKGYASKIKIDQENQKNLEVVSSQIMQIENILNNILDLSEIDANKLSLKRNDYHLISFLNKHYADFKALFDSKNINFNLNETTSNITVNMDVNLISKAINNILSNALKFTPKNGIVNINVNLDHDLSIEFSDNGIGIPNEDLDKIFYRFYQSKNHITQSQGSGIGLSFTQSILKAHGFSIKATSTPNINTSFIITIPEKHISLDNNENTSTTNTTKNLIIETETAQENNKNVATILIVDDHKQMRDYLATILSNYNLIQAEDGKEALEIIKNHPIDLLVTDYMMPIMDGEALVKEVKKMQLKTPIIILTARVDDFAKLNMLRIGVDGYLNKPFVEEELQLFVKNSLQLYKNIIEEEQNYNEIENNNINEFEDEFHSEITEFILKNITDLDFNINDIANYLNISQTTLNRKCKSILGQTTNKVILQVKIEKARELQLKRPHLSKKEIGYSVGIKNTSHLFNKIAERYGSHYHKM